MRGTENYTGTAEIAEHDAQNSFLSVFHAADYLSTARAAASREKSKSRTTQTRKANLQEGKMITGYEVCKDPAEGEFQKNGHAADAMCRLPAVKTYLSHTRSACRLHADDNVQTTHQ